MVGDTHHTKRLLISTLCLEDADEFFHPLSDPRLYDFIGSQAPTSVVHLDIRHVYIRPRTPRLNGKVERSHRIDNEEFYELVDQGGLSDDIRLFNSKLREWEDYYNFHRPHGGLGGQTPYERLLEKSGAELKTKS